MSDHQDKLTVKEDRNVEAQAAQTAVAVPVRRRRRGLRALLLLVVPLLAITVGGYFYAMSGRYIETDNAYVKAHKLAVSSDIDGRVSAVHVAENQRVRAGDLLLEIDSRPFEIELAEAEADLARARSQIARLKVEHSAAEAELAETRARISHLESQAKRYRGLSERGIAASAKYEEVEADLIAARRRVDTQQERVRQALVAIGGNVNRATETHPLYLAAKARRDQALLWLEYTRVTAPSDGIVAAINLEAGEFVEKGDPIFALVDDTAPWVEANLKETQLTYLIEGQKAEVEIDAYPGIKWLARVQGIAPATGAEFSILPPQNASGNWVKVVQRVPVRLMLQPNPDRPPLRAGMTASISIDTERERKLVTQARAAIGMPSDIGLRMANQ